MAYQRLGGGYAGRFGEGMRNPRYGINAQPPAPNSTQPTPQRPSGRATPQGKPFDPNYRGEEWQNYMVPGSKPPGDPGYTRNYGTANPNAQGSQGRHYGRKAPSNAGFWAKINRQRNEGLSGGRPEIPEFAGYEGSKWTAPDIGIPEAGVDTRAVVDATRHFLDEKMATEGGEAAARLGKLGVLSSGGGQGMGYAGTLGESERARDRDLAALYYKYDYDAAQQDANRRSAAREGGLNRSLSAHEGFEGRGFAGNRDRQDYDRWRYGAELTAADEEERRANREMLMATYGM